MHEVRLRQNHGDRLLLMLEDKRNSGIRRTSEISMPILINTIVEKEFFSYFLLLRRNGEGILEYNGMVFFFTYGSNENDINNKRINIRK